MDTASGCDVMITGTPIGLGRLIDIRHPVRHGTYGLADHGGPTPADVPQPLVQADQKHLVVVGAIEDYSV